MSWKDQSDLVIRLDNLIQKSIYSTIHKGRAKRKGTYRRKLREEQERKWRKQYYRNLPVEILEQEQRTKKYVSRLWELGTRHGTHKKVST